MTKGNELASAVTAYTPRYPVTVQEAEGVRALVTDSLTRLAQAVDEYLAANGRRLGDGNTTTAGSEEEIVIIITAPPPR